MNRPVFGPDRQPLGHPATTRLLQRLWFDDDAELDAIRRRERNDAIFTEAIRRCWRDGFESESSLRLSPTGETVKEPQR